MLEDNPLRAWYGEGHVFKAAERGAIGKLLVSDELFRCVFCLSITARAHTDSPHCLQSTLGREEETLRQAGGGRQSVWRRGAYVLVDARVGTAYVSCLSSIL